MTTGRKEARCLMVQGTGSHTGKSIIATALCRILARDGRRVAPFKAQNMSLNSCVTPDGGEMGRAQILQAQAAGVEPNTDMNPILLKPSSNEMAQVVLNGRPFGHMGAWEYHNRKLEFFPAALEALARLRAGYDFVIIEGAGSPAEINLSDKDITNMRVARASKAPVLLVGDIDRGGVFASLLGTIDLLEAREREMVAGFIVNKFRGSLDLLEGGLRSIHERTGIRVLGVVPYIEDLGLEEEDSMGLGAMGGPDGGGNIEIAVLRLQHVSNFTDFDPLAREPGVVLRYAGHPGEVGFPDALILPGTKSTVNDLAHLRRSGMDRTICRLAAVGVPVIGICGGYQMLGERIEDPEGVESGDASVSGLGLLPVRTRMVREKNTHRVEARATRPIPALGLDELSPVMKGYEIHMGESEMSCEPALVIESRGGAVVEVADGALSEDGNVFGCYIHGLFENAAVLEGFCNFLRTRGGLAPREAGCDWTEHREARLDNLADVVSSSLDMRSIFGLIGI